MGAYQESLSGYGGIQHCLIPGPKLVIIDRDEEGEYFTKLFAKEQSYKSMLKILGYWERSPSKPPQTPFPFGDFPHKGKKKEKSFWEAFGSAKNTKVRKYEII